MLEVFIYSSILKCSKKIRAASAPAKETNSSCRWSHAQYYKRQVEQIKLLAAHYRPSEEGTSQDFKVTSCFDEGACKTARKSGHYNRRRGNKDVLEHVHAPDWKPGLFDAADVLGIGAEHNSDSAMEETATVDHTGTAEVNDGKISSKFTPKGSEEKGANFGANFGANWSQGCTCSTSLQPMKVAEQGASIINMPSLLQGQAFSDIPPEGVKVHKLHHRSISQPASRGFSYPAAPTSSCWQGQERPRETETTGWRRGAHSATMYTRYRSPEFALMYGDMESTTASCVWVLNNSECRKKLR